MTKKMRLDKSIFLSIIFLLLLCSCDKEKEERIPIMAGTTNNDMLYYEFNPPLELQLQLDTLKKIKLGIDSVDIDLDGIFDIIINQRIYLNWSDGFNRSYLKKDDFPFIGLRLKNGFEVACKNLSFPVGMGTTNSVNMVDTIPYKKRLNKINNWHDSKMHSLDYMGYYNNNIWLWGAPPTIFWLLGNFGTWYRLSNKEMYIGIRKKLDTEYKLGWVKIKVFNHDKFEILSYAIEK
jgi:hypothetical protein